MPAEEEEVLRCVRGCWCVRAHEPSLCVGQVRMLTLRRGCPMLAVQTARAVRRRLHVLVAGEGWTAARVAKPFHCGGVAVI